MEKYEVIGIQHKTGNYNGKDYDNMVFSVTSPGNERNGDIGLRTIKTMIYNRPG